MRTRSWALPCRTRPGSSSQTATSTLCSCRPSARPRDSRIPLPPPLSTVSRHSSTSTSATRASEAARVRHRAGMLPEEAVALLGCDVTEEIGRKLLAAAVQRGERDLRSVRGVRRELIERIELQTTAEPLRIPARAWAPAGFLKYPSQLRGGAAVEAAALHTP